MCFQHIPYDIPQIGARRTYCPGKIGQRGYHDPLPWSLPASGGSLRTGRALSADSPVIVAITLGRVFHPMAEPYSGYPEQREYSAENIHNRKHHARYDHEDLQQAASGQRHRQHPPGQASQEDRGDRGDPGDRASRRRRYVAKLDSRNNRECDNDRLKNEHSRAKPADELPISARSWRLPRQLLTRACPPIPVIGPRLSRPRLRTPIIAPLRSAAGERRRP